MLTVSFSTPFKSARLKLLHDSMNLVFGQDYFLKRLDVLSKLSSFGDIGRHRCFKFTVTDKYDYRVNDLRRYFKGCLDRSDVPVVLF